MDEGPPITLLLQRVSAGETEAADQLFEAVYAQLRGLAGWFIRRERPGHTLQPTALVNEVYLRMLGAAGQDWTNRALGDGLNRGALRISGRGGGIRTRDPLRPRDLCGFQGLHRFSPNPNNYNNLGNVLFVRHHNIEGVAFKKLLYLAAPPLGFILVPAALFTTILYGIVLGW